jgi:hypothetical protein
MAYLTSGIIAPQFLILLRLIQIMIVLVMPVTFVLTIPKMTRIVMAFVEALIIVQLHATLGNLMRIAMV